MTFKYHFEGQKGAESDPWALRWTKCSNPDWFIFITPKSNLYLVVTFSKFKVVCKYYLITSQTTINVKLPRCSLKSKGQMVLQRKLKLVHTFVLLQVSVIDEGLLRFSKLEELVLSANVISEIPAENLPCTLKVSHQASSEWWCNILLQFRRIISDLRLFQHVSEDSYSWACRAGSNSVSWDSD